MDCPAPIPDQHLSEHTQQRLDDIPAPTVVWCPLCDGGFVV